MYRKTAILLTSLLTACAGVETECNDYKVCMSGYAVNVGGKVVTGRVYFDEDKPKEYKPGGGETSDHAIVEAAKIIIPAAAIVKGLGLIDTSTSIKLPTGLR